MLGFILPIIIIVLAITVHEFAHALAADRLGDPTSRLAGRLSLNPLAHLDPVGSLMFLLAGFGWGKPVPVDSYNFSSPRRDETIVSLAGPASNILLFVIFGILNKFAPELGSLWYLVASINLTLAIFNLLPLPPLDGSHILLNLLPIQASMEWSETLSRYGQIILILIFLIPFGSSNILSQLIGPPIHLLMSIFF